jgi:thymidylate kinase
MGIPTLTRRGDGMRKGLGNEATDPESRWWQENIARMRATGFEGPESMAAATESANRLQRELFVAKNYFMPRLLEKEGKDSGVILLDRGLISRLFVKRREMPEADLESVRDFESSRGKREVIMPDLIFLFHAPLETLLARNLKRDTSGKAAFNETVLTRYYGDFEAIIANLPEEIKKRTVNIDSRQTIEEINRLTTDRVLGLVNHGKEGQFLTGVERG